MTGASQSPDSLWKLGTLGFYPSLQVAGFSLGASLAGAVRRALGSKAHFSSGCPAVNSLTRTESVLHQLCQSTVSYIKQYKQTSHGSFPSGRESRLPIRCLCQVSKACIQFTNHFNLFSGQNLLWLQPQRMLAPLRMVNRPVWSSCCWVSGEIHS